MIKLKTGMLVKPRFFKVESSYSGYAGRPKMYFDLGMLGVIRLVDALGIQIEYIDPVSGCVERVRAFQDNLEVVAWPDICADLSKVIPENGLGNNYWFCGSMNFMGCIQYIKAIALYSFDYLQLIELKTVRVPGVHASRLRSGEPEPEVYLHKNKQILDKELRDVLTFA